MAGFSLYCSSSLGAVDPRCVPTSIPILPIVSATAPEKVVPQEVNEILGYAMTVCAVFCIYFCILCVYKIFRGHSVLFSMRFALCGAQRFLFDRTARLGMSYFVTPVVSSVPTVPITNPAGYSTPIPMLVLASVGATSVTSPPVQVSPEMPIYSDPTELSDRCMGVVVFVD
jgi:hypothetical protein